MISAEERDYFAPLRSSLYVPVHPAHFFRMMKENLKCGADSLIMDLEDTCLPKDKAQGRKSVRQAMEDLDWGKVKATVRINGMETDLWQEDLDVIVCRQLFMVRLPKTETADQVRTLDSILGFLEARRGIKPGSIRIAVGLESPLGIMKAWEIANASPRVAFMSGGGGLDYHAQMQSERMPDGTETLFANSLVLHVCHATGISPYKGIHPIVGDIDGLIKTSEWARSMGFLGRTCMDPSHVEHVNRIFSPSPKKVEWAKRVVAAIKEGRKKGYGEVILDGVLVGVGTMIEAKRIFAQSGLDFEEIEQNSGDVRELSQSQSDNLPSFGS